LTEVACSDGYVPDVIHSHGLWLDVNRKAFKLSRSLGIPLTISPCGMLQQDALQRSKWKKRLLWFVFQKHVLLSADVVHAKSDTEALCVREILPRVNTEVIPNPIETPPDHVLNEQSENKNRLKIQLFGKYDVSPEQRILLFLGRVHAVKGLERLIDAWLSIFEEFPDWVLLIVGPDEDGHLQKLKSVVAETIPPTRSIEKINHKKSPVVFAAPIFGDQRWKAYASADLFVAPSSFENFGQSIAEALCAGVPVITTTTTPWKELKENGCGWFIDPSIDSIASALKEAMSLGDSERTAKGRIGKQLVRQCSPHVVAEQMCSLYRSLRVTK
jgi:glycosyltransferase involved in cell wall biosynthesis